MTLSKRARPLGKSGEAKLIDAAKEVMAWVEEDGLHPNDAIAKVAFENEVPEGWQALLVQAYNHGRMTAQREGCGKDLLCKLSEFPLADLKEVQSRVAGLQKTAETLEKDEVASIYDEPIPKYRYKEAAELPHVEVPEKPLADEFVIARQRRDLTRAEEAIKKAEEETTLAEWDLYRNMGKFAEYFRKRRQDRLSMGEVEHYGSRSLGPSVKCAMDFVQRALELREDRSKPITSGLVDLQAEPYVLLKAAVESAKRLVACQEKVAKCKKIHGPKRESFYVKPRKKSALFEDPEEKPRLKLQKNSGLFSGLLGGAVTVGARETMRPSPRSELVEGVMEDISTPEHEAELRRIQAQTLLHDLMTNDDVISAYDPDEILSAYNELSQLSPRAATQRAIVQPMLRRRLSAGGIEPFEAQQLVDIEKGLKAVSPQDTTATPKPEAGP